MGASANLCELWSKYVASRETLDYRTTPDASTPEQVSALFDDLLARTKAAVGKAPAEIKADLETTRVAYNEIAAVYAGYRYDLSAIRTEPKDFTDGMTNIEEHYDLTAVFKRFVDYNAKTCPGT